MDRSDKAKAVFESLTCDRIELFCEHCQRLTDWMAYGGLWVSMGRNKPIGDDDWERCLDCGILFVYAGLKNNEPGYTWTGYAPVAMAPDSVNWPAMMANRPHE